MAGENALAEGVYKNILYDISDDDRPSIHTVYAPTRGRIWWMLVQDTMFRNRAIERLIRLCRDGGQFDVNCFNVGLCVDPTFIYKFMSRYTNKRFCSKIKISLSCLI